MKTRLSTATRLLLVIAAAGLIAVLFTPIWRIDLSAPQYPEGLSLQIHATGLKGNVDIINGLNHYIGMKTLHNEDFFEFRILPYAIVFFAALFLFTAMINKRTLLYTCLVLFIAFGILAMYDFWKWEYNYGHNLDPDAAIKVPGMAYQPPLIGFKQLLNFGAYSFPSVGGWLFIGAGIILATITAMEWKRQNFRPPVKTVLSMFILCFAITSTGCNSGPESIVPGKDNCYFCKMKISDPRYAAELITRKGKIYKFDDAHCLLSFMNSKMIDDVETKDVYIADYNNNHQLLHTSKAFLLKGGNIRGPMNGDIIAVSSKESLDKASTQFNASEIKWVQLVK